MTYTLLLGDCRETLASLPDASVHCCVTSPPYFGLRDYGHDGQIGLEATPDAYVTQMVAVFREVRRVLRDDGTLWLNLGDSYAGGGGHSPNAPSSATSKSGRYGDALKEGGIKPQGVIKPKDLIGIPWRVALALQADGWFLRQDIIWHKPNPMPESVTDRCTKAHEYIFLLSKSARYFYDAEAVREPLKPGADHSRKRGHTSLGLGQSSKGGQRFRKDGTPVADASHVMESNPAGRNRRSVWTVSTKPYAGAHFATFPPDLIEPCILAGAPKSCCAKCGAPVERVVDRKPMVIDRSERTHERGHTRASGTMLEPASAVTTGWRQTCSCNAGTVPGTVLDPFGGSGTTAGVAIRNGRRAILCELNPAYAALVDDRVRSIAGETPDMFREAAE